MDRQHLPAETHVPSGQHVVSGSQHPESQGVLLAEHLEIQLGSLQAAPCGQHINSPKLLQHTKPFGQKPSSQHSVSGQLQKPGQGTGRSGEQQGVPGLGLQISDVKQHWPSAGLQHFLPEPQHADGPQHSLPPWPASGQQWSPGGQQISPRRQQISRLQGVEPIG